MRAEGFALDPGFTPLHRQISRRRCRELLRGGRESDGPIGPIVVNIVRREICEADRVVEFRSPNVRVPGAP